MSLNKHLNKHRCILLLALAFAMLLLQVCACTDKEADATPPQQPGSPLPPGSQQPSPTQPPGLPAPADDAGPSAQAPDVDTGPSAQTPDADTGSAEPTSLSGEVVISFDFVRQSGSASNQHAVWIEDMEGNVVRTLYASRWTANGGYRTRPDSIALWAGRADLANMASSEVDAVSGATPATGPLSYTWDLTDSGGNTVAPGDYAFFVEGTLRWKNFVIYSGIISLGVRPATVQADADFTFQGDGRYATLTETSGETDMIGPVTAVFAPGVD